MKYLTIIVFLWVNLLQAQVRLHTVIGTRDSLMQYELEYGNKKQFVDSFKLATLIALSYFPELKNVAIKFKLGKTKTTMETKPIWHSIFFKPKKYKIIIRANALDSNGILAKHVPFNALIGLVGHELAHIVDFENKSIGQLLSTALKYGIGKQNTYEKSIDYATMQRGLYWQLYDWADFVVNKSYASPKYIAFKKKNYLSEKEILQWIKLNQSQ